MQSTVQFCGGAVLSEVSGRSTSHSLLCSSHCCAWWRWVVYMIFGKIKCKLVRKKVTHSTNPLSAIAGQTWSREEYFEWNKLNSFGAEEGTLKRMSIYIGLQIHWPCPVNVQFLGNYFSWKNSSHLKWKILAQLGFLSWSTFSSKPHVEMNKRYWTKVGKRIDSENWALMEKESRQDLTQTSWRPANLPESCWNGRKQT